MLLAVDVGNTQTVFGLFDGDSLIEQFRVGTDRSHTGDELAVMLRAFVDLATLDGIVLCSSVPQLVHEYETFAERWAKVPLLVLGPGVPTGMAIRYDDPREVGPDRIANAVAARERHGAPARRRRLRHLDELRRRLGCGRVRRRRARARGSRSRWTPSSRARPGCRRCRSRRPSG